MTSTVIGHQAPDDGCAARGAGVKAGAGCSVSVKGSVQNGRLGDLMLDRLMLGGLF
jgi:hypothetical protein